MLDCDGDRSMDYACTNSITGARGTELSTSACARVYPNAAATSGPAVFMVPPSPSPPPPPSPPSPPPPSPRPPPPPTKPGCSVGGLLCNTSTSMLVNIDCDQVLFGGAAVLYLDSYLDYGWIHNTFYISSSP